MATKGVVPFQLLKRSRGVLFGLILSASLAGEGWAALSGSTERIRDLIAKHDFPASDPAMDTRQQFIVFSPDRRFSRELLGEVMTLRQRVYHFFGISKIWDQPAFILIFPSREKYGLRSTGGAAIQFKYHGQNVRIIASYLQERLKERILPHEMVHFLIADLSAVGSARGGKPPELPIFINEGIAEYFTAHTARRILFEKTIWETFQARKLEPFKKIVTSTESWIEALAPGETSRVKHAQGYSIISFLASLPGGNLKLRNYVMSYGTLANRVPRESASLRAFEMAFRQDYSSWQELQNRWHQYIRERQMLVVEAESASVADSSGEKWEIRSASKEKLSFSGGKELLFHASDTGSFLTLQTIMPSAGTYDVYAIYTRSPQGGRFRLAINEKQFRGIFNGYANKKRLCEPVYYGKSLLADGPMTLRFSLVGKEAISGGFEVGMDCILFRRDARPEQRN
ncbi:hypothetical protein HQ563_00180 [bacterium]|nr:hypothetical protein [bacterium]